MVDSSVAMATYQVAANIGFWQAAHASYGGYGEFTCGGKQTHVVDALDQLESSAWKRQCLTLAGSPLAIAHSGAVLDTDEPREHHLSNEERGEQRARQHAHDRANAHNISRYMKLHPPLAAHFEAHQAATRLPGLNIEHYAIGLAEEAAEVLEATEPTDVDIASAQEECGDLLWYLVGIMRCANLSTADLFQRPEPRPGLADNPPNRGGPTRTEFGNGPCICAESRSLVSQDPRVPHPR